MQCNRLPRILIEATYKFGSMYFYISVKSKPQKSKSQWDGTSLPLGWLLSKKERKITSVIKDAEKLEPLFNAGDNEKWCSCCGKYLVFLKS